jgi:hypothetical protein
MQIPGLSKELRIKLVDKRNRIHKNVANHLRFICVTYTALLEDEKDSSPSAMEVTVADSADIEEEDGKDGQDDNIFSNPVANNNNNNIINVNANTDNNNNIDNNTNNINTDDNNNNNDNDDDNNNNNNTDNNTDNNNDNNNDSGIRNLVAAADEFPVLRRTSERKSSKKIIFDPSESHQIIRSPVTKRLVRPTGNHDEEEDSPDVNTSEQIQSQVNTNTSDNNDDNDVNNSNNTSNNTNNNIIDEIYAHEDLMKLYTPRDVDCCRHLLAESRRRTPPLLRGEYDITLKTMFKTLFPGMNLD